MNTHGRNLFARKNQCHNGANSTCSNNLTHPKFVKFAPFAKFVSPSFAKLAAILFLLPLSLSAQNINIIPLPNSIIKGNGVFALSDNTIIGANSDTLLPQANYLQNELRKSEGWTIAVDPNEEKANIDLRLVKNKQSAGSYNLKVEAGKVTISAADNQGVFYGVVSLLQLIKNQPQANAINLPAVEINDAPRYQWRGFMLDESRHFFGKEKVKQLLDWMAFYKLDKFHWHLTDVDGWRFEVGKYPNLTTVGAVGNHTDTAAAAKYYTREDIKEIVAYAGDRFITVIPEIDMPGHATAANKAYPEYSGGVMPRYPNFTFDPSNEKTYGFLTDVVKETSTLFHSQMIHLGGDEVSYGIQAWAGKPGISQIMTNNKFSSLADVEHYFFKRMADSVFSLNDRVLCWDEAAETDLPADKTIVLWWRQNEPAQLELALQKKYDVVLCPRLPMYLDFVQDVNNTSGRKWSGEFFNPISNIYNYPDLQMPAEELQSNLILGVQANLWTETVGSEKRLDYMIFPRLAALAESAWTNQSAKNETSFNERLKANFALYDKAGIYYYNPFDPQMHPEVVDFVPLVKKSYGSIKNRHGRKSKHHKGGNTTYASNYRHLKTRRKHQI